MKIVFAVLMLPGFALLVAVVLSTFRRRKDNVMDDATDDHHQRNKPET